MIVREVGDHLWLFDQNDHARLCGEMAAAWGAAPFSPMPEPVRRAAGFHDNGWQEWDVRPRLNPKTGRPHPYSDMPPDDYLAIWQRGLARAWRLGDVEGLLISLHGMRFFRRKNRPEDQAFFRAEQTRQADALRRLGASPADPEALPEPFADWHAWMFFWDGLSLFLCEGWDSPWTSRVPDGAGAETELRACRLTEEEVGARVVVEPFPFRSALVLQVTARRVPNRVYTTQSELDRAVGSAERHEVRWVVAEGAGTRA